MLVERLSASTATRLAVIGITADVRCAVQWLSRPGVGLVLVCADDGRLQGVVSKSDLVRHMAGSALTDSPVADLMSRSIVSCAPDDDVRTVWTIMTAGNLQNIPVIDAHARPVGVLEIRDVMNVLYAQEEMQEKMLTNYVAGVGYR
ncbi:MAG: CBS domain-containing protein [Chelatococcus sp.]|nr:MULTISPECIES: CBS domain-containing protein [unclassified Chelatococcus]MBS7700159.1 CBS domain-containing protein [Chelatococcus sp. YT9]MBX3556852.1 CBS domain-containing protein [Chelatococcus sp.]